MTARTWILAAGLLAGFAAPSFATDDVPVRGNWLWQVGWRRWPAVMPSYYVAPWYLWWPADATETLQAHNFQTSPYPTWPNPHAGIPAQRPAGAMTYAPSQRPSSARPAQPVPIQPAYYPASYPPNSYGR